MEDFWMQVETGAVCAVDMTAPEKIERLIKNLARKVKERTPVTQVKARATS